MKEIRRISVAFDEETALLLRIESAKRDKSMSALIRELVEDYFLERESVDRYLGRCEEAGLLPLKTPSDN